MHSKIQTGLHFVMVLFLLFLIMDSAVCCAAEEDKATISPYDFPYDFLYGYPFPEYPTAGASHPGVSADYK